MTDVIRCTGDENCQVPHGIWLIESGEAGQQVGLYRSDLGYAPWQSPRSINNAARAMEAKEK